MHHPFRLPRLLLAALPLLVAAPRIVSAQHRPGSPDPHDSIDVASLTFEGARQVPASDLRLVIFTRPSSCRLILVAPACKLTPSLLFTDRRRTTRAALGKDITALRVYYWRRGYRDAQVDTLLASAKRGTDVTFRIVEGPPTLVGSITVTQRTPVLGDDELRHALLLREGDPVSLIALDSTMSRLRDATWNHGYGDVQVDTTLPPPDASRRVAIGITVDPRWRTRVGAVHFEGNAVLSDATLQRGVLLQPGTLYTRDAVLESERRLFKSPALARALVIAPPAGDSVKDVTIAVTEMPPHRGTLTVGFNTVEFIQAGVQYRNSALGDGRWMELRANAGNLLGEQLNGRAIFRQAIPDDTPDATPFLRPTYQSSLTLAQPWIAGPRTSASAMLFAGRRSLPGVVVDEDLGVTIGVVRELGTRLPIGVNYRLETTRVQGGAVYFCAGYGICDDATIAAVSRWRRLAPLGASAWIDRSNDLENPTRGYTAVVDAEHASSLTASSFTHDRIAIDGSYYRPFGDARDNVDNPARPIVVALHGHAGVVRPSGVLHPRARFYAGGMQSVRGYSENELGPQVLQVRRASLLASGCSDATIAAGSCDPSAVPSSEFFTRPTGGTSVVEGSVEARIPMSRVLSGVVFLDGAYVGTGGLTTSAHAAGAITPGGGFRYRSPLGVLRLDVGLRPVGEQSLPVVVAVDDGSGGQRIVALAQEKRFSILDPSQGTLRGIAKRLVVHFAMGQAF